MDTNLPMDRNKTVDDVRAWMHAIHAHGIGNYSDAVAAYRQTDGNSGRRLYNMACAYIRLSDTKSAIECLDNAIKQDDNMAIAYFQRGGMHLQERSYEAAIYDLEMAKLILRGNRYINYKPLGLTCILHACEILFNLALAYYHDNEVTEALHVLTEACHDSEEYDPYNNRIKSAIVALKAGARLTAEPFRISSNRLFEPPKFITDNLDTLDLEHSNKVKVIFKSPDDQQSKDKRKKLPKTKSLDDNKLSSHMKRKKMDSLGDTIKKTFLKSQSLDDSRLTHRKGVDQVLVDDMDIEKATHTTASDQNSPVSNGISDSDVQDVYQAIEIQGNDDNEDIKTVVNQSDSHVMEDDMLAEYDVASAHVDTINPESCPVNICLHAANMEASPSGYMNIEDMQLPSGYMNIEAMQLPSGYMNIEASPSGYMNIEAKQLDIKVDQYDATYATADSDDIHFDGNQDNPCGIINKTEAYRCSKFDGSESDHVVEGYDVMNTTAGADNKTFETGRSERMQGLHDIKDSKTNIKSKNDSLGTPPFKNTATCMGTRKDTSAPCSAPNLLAMMQKPPQRKSGSKKQMLPLDAKRKTPSSALSNFKSMLSGKKKKKMADENFPTIVMDGFQGAEALIGMIADVAIDRTDATDVDKVNESMEQPQQPNDPQTKSLSGVFGDRTTVLRYGLCEACDVVTATVTPTSGDKGKKNTLKTMKQSGKGVFLKRSETAQGGATKGVQDSTNQFADSLLATCELFKAFLVTDFADDCKPIDADNHTAKQIMKDDLNNNSVLETILEETCEGDGNNNVHPYTTHSEAPGDIQTHMQDDDPQTVQEMTKEVCYIRTDGELVRLRRAKCPPPAYPPPPLPGAKFNHNTNHEHETPNLTTNQPAITDNCIRNAHVYDNSHIGSNYESDISMDDSVFINQSFDSANVYQDNDSIIWKDSVTDMQNNVI